MTQKVIMFTVPRSGTTTAKIVSGCADLSTMLDEGWTVAHLASDGAGAFCAVLNAPPNLAARLNTERVLALFKSPDWYTWRDLCDASDLPVSELRDELRALCKRGQLEREWIDKTPLGPRFRLKPS